MASGLQCPGCGHVHPAGLPEIARGDPMFRCYGCYRTLSVPEGWTGRPAPRPPAPPSLTGDAPPGAGTRDARRARLARAVLDGERGPQRDIVVLNGAAALLAAGLVGDLAAGVEAAVASLDGGRAAAALDGLGKVSRQAAEEEAG